MEDEQMSDHPGLIVDDKYFAEQFPLSPLDDFLIHQTPDPVRVMWTGDPARTSATGWSRTTPPAMS